MNAQNVTGSVSTTGNVTVGAFSVSLVGGTSSQNYALIGDGGFAWGSQVKNATVGTRTVPAAVSTIGNVTVLASGGDMSLSGA